VELHAARSSPGQKYLVCNSDEGEPGTCKDRDILLAFNPHIVVEGMIDRGLLDGRAHGLQLHPRRNLRGVPALRGSPGRSQGGRPTWANASSARDFSFQLHAHHGYGAYICGEETALLESLEGKKGQPRFKPPFPASFGLYGKPTTINNTETFAAVPWIIVNGGQPYLEVRSSPTTAAPRSSRWSGDVEPSRAITRSRWARRLRSCWNSPAACSERAQAQGRDPGRLVRTRAARRHR
jgi:NADH-quinone oxidoreductase subunit F